MNVPHTTALGVGVMGSNGVSETDMGKASLGHIDKYD